MAKGFLAIQNSGKANKGQMHRADSAFLKRLWQWPSLVKLEFWGKYRKLIYLFHLIKSIHRFHIVENLHIGHPYRGHTPPHTHTD